MNHDLIDETLITSVKKVRMLLNKPAEDLINNKCLIFEGNFGKKVVLFVNNLEIVLETGL